MAPSVEITNVAAGVTRWIAFPISPGDIAWRDPVLAPQGPPRRARSRRTWARDLPVGWQPSLPGQNEFGGAQEVLGG